MAEEGCKLFVYGIDQNMANGDIQVSDDDDEDEHSSGNMAKLREDIRRKMSFTFGHCPN